jgi:hypothetical protein
MQDISLSWPTIAVMVTAVAVAISCARRWAKKRDAENAILAENQVLILYEDGEWRAYFEILDPKPRSHFFSLVANRLVKKELLKDRIDEVNYLGLKDVVPGLKRYKITKDGLAHLKALEDVKKSHSSKSFR